MNYSIKRSISVFILPATLAFSGLAFAQEEGQCETDSDCGEYMECAAAATSGCALSPDGSVDCLEPDPDARGYCAPAYVTCQTDDECPREFECMFYESCLDIACAEGATCDQPACAPASEGQCSPKEVRCEANSDCPSDWSCLGTTEWECPDEIGAGGASSGSGSGSSRGEPTPADADSGMESGDQATSDAENPAAPEDELPVCVEVPAVGYCQPDAWSNNYFGASDTGAPVSSGDMGSGSEPTVDKGDTAEGEDNEDVGSGTVTDSDFASDAGCSVTTVDPRRSGAWGWFLLLAVPMLRRRRGSQAGPQA